MHFDDCLLKTGIVQSDFPASVTVGQWDGGKSHNHSTGKAWAIGVDNSECESVSILVCSESVVDLSLVELVLLKSKMKQ